MAIDAAVVVTAETERRLTLDVHCEFRKTVLSIPHKFPPRNKETVRAGRLTAQVKLLVRTIPTVVVSITLPVRLDAYMVLALKEKRGAVRAVGKAGC